MQNNRSKHRRDTGRRPLPLELEPGRSHRIRSQVLAGNRAQKRLPFWRFHGDENFRKAFP